MTTTMQPTPFLPGQAYRGGTNPHKIPSSKITPSKGIWLSMLDEVSSGKDLAEKQLIILGGTPNQQREFLNTLNPLPSESSQPRTHQRRNRTTKPATAAPISNRFALGYTYYDVFDTDQQDVVARLSVYMLSNPSAAFASLLKPLFTAKTVPNTLITILLDWEDPFQWPAQLRQWVRVLRSVVAGLEEDVKVAMEETMGAWKERRVGVEVEGIASAARVVVGGGVENRTPVGPLGPGEWEDQLGVPLSVVCLNAEKEERMEKEYGWQEGDFDFVLQWMRCVLLKHGASLIYTTSFDSNNVRTLIHSSLGIQSLLKRETVRHNVIDRDKVLIPPNWDSWGKIRTLREGFEMETVANSWSVEIQTPPEVEFDPSTNTKSSANRNAKRKRESEDTPSDEDNAVSIFISSLPNPSARTKPLVPSAGADDIVTIPDPQTFLAEQARILESLRLEDERDERRTGKAVPFTTGSMPFGTDQSAARAQLAELAGAPYNINVGGIQVDAEEVTRRIRQREADRDRESNHVKTPRKGVEGGGGQASGAATSDGGKLQNEALANYFAGLMKKAKGSSESHSPRGGSSSAAGR